MAIFQKVTFRRNLDFGVTYSRLPRQPDLACEAYMGYYRPLALLRYAQSSRLRPPGMPSTQYFKEFS